MYRGKLGVDSKSRQLVVYLIDSLVSCLRAHLQGARGSSETSTARRVLRASAVNCMCSELAVNRHHAIVQLLHKSRATDTSFQSGYVGSAHGPNCCCCILAALSRSVPIATDKFASCGAVPPEWLLEVVVRNGARQNTLWRHNTIAAGIF